MTPLIIGGTATAPTQTNNGTPVQFTSDPINEGTRPFVFINVTNHPSDKWDAQQREAARQYGEVIDLPFPAVDPYATSSEIEQLAATYLELVTGIAAGRQPIVHLMGEMTFTYALVQLLKARGIPCLASTTSRDVVMLPDGTKQVAFHFCQFREY